MNGSELIQTISVLALPLIFAITLHEVAHGYVAFWCGDYTAKLSGRLSLNPIRHIDLFGTILIPLLMLIFTHFIFGWAKPVPVDSRNLRHPRRDMALVAVAGPLSNLIMALFWGLAAKLGLGLMEGGNDWFGKPIYYMGLAGVQINLLLGVLNLIPIPPLDGAKVLSSILPRRAAYHFSFLEPYGFFILILLLVSGILTQILVPAIQYLQMLIFNLLQL